MTTRAKPALEQLPYSTSQTGLVYDVRIRFNVEVRPEVNQGVHPEDPRRIYAIYKELVDAGLVDDPSTVSLAPSVLARIPTRFVQKSTRACIQKTHGGSTRYTRN